MTTLVQTRPALEYIYGEDEYGPMHTVGLAPGLHHVHDILDLEEDIDLRTEVATICRNLGAPPEASDHQYAWLDTCLENTGWLWISYRPGYRPLHMRRNPAP